MKVISGIYRPTGGQVQVRGQIVPMLELGSGFDAELSGRENIRFLLLKDKNHNPTYTPEAVVYKNAFWDTLQKKWKKGLLATKEAQAAFMARYDFARMTAQDEGVWAEILNHLES